MNSISESHTSLYQQYAFSLTQLIENGEWKIISENIKESSIWAYKIILIKRKTDFLVYLLIKWESWWTQAIYPHHKRNEDLWGKANTSYISRWNASFSSEQEAKEYFQDLSEKEIYFATTTSSEGTLYTIKTRAIELL